MCGVNCVVSTRQKVSDFKSYLDAANLALDHRGPDYRGLSIFDEFNVGFGHTRLAIIDLDPRSNQPMTSGDSRFSIVFNGEIYNYLELRAECEKAGSVFTTNSDTEVIFESYRHWGPAVFKRFEGMWAFCLLDRVEKNLIICRDPFGIKPLYYSLDSGNLFLSSEIAPLKAAFSGADKIDQVTVSLFETYGILQRGCWTFFEHIKKVPQSHYAVINLSEGEEALKPEFINYWDFCDFDKLNLSSESYLHELKKSVEKHTRADVEVGVTLSGGLDSSVITHLAGAKVKKGFTSSFDKKLGIDETEKAAFVCKLANIEHLKAFPTADTLKNDFEQLIKAQEEPFGTLSIYTQFKIFEKIHESGLKVSLDGQGADESLGGYKFIMNYALKEFRGKGFLTYLSNLALIFQRHRKDPNFQFTNLAFEKPISSKLDSIKSIIITENGGDLEERLSLLNRPMVDLRHLLLTLTFESNLPQLLHYVDRNSMNFSVESRVPFLTLKLALIGSSLPVDELFKFGKTKWFLRSAFRKQLHPSTYNETIKLGFPAPDDEWLKSWGQTRESFRTFLLDLWRQQQGLEFQ